MLFHDSQHVNIELLNDAKIRTGTLVSLRKAGVGGESGCLICTHIVNWSLVAWLEPKAGAPGRLGSPGA